MHSIRLIHESQEEPAFSFFLIDLLISGVINKHRVDSWDRRSCFKQRIYKAATRTIVMKTQLCDSSARMVCVERGKPWHQILPARLLFWTAGFMLLLGIQSCNDPLDPSSYNGQSGTYAKVSVLVDSSSTSQQGQSSSRLLNKSGVSPPNGTALVIAVPSGTAFSADYNSISEYYDKQLVDLATSTVTLNLPLGTPIQLFEYVFMQSYSLSSLSGSDRFVFSRAILGPVTLTGSTTSIELEANLEYVLEKAFDILLDDGTFNIGFDKLDSVLYYTYEAVNWQSLVSTSYLFNSTSRIFEVGESPKKSYELIDYQWIETTGHTPSATFDHLDRSTLTAYYTNPTFSATLVGLMDLAAIGLDDNDGSGDDGDKNDGFMEKEDFTPGAMGYIFEINGMVDAEYRLEKIAESHDCTGTQFTTLEDYITHHTSTEFACQDHGDGNCLRFQLDATGDTSGDIIEIVRDDDYNIIDQYTAGTWAISTVQTKEMLFFYPDNKDYYHDGTWASFWSVLNGKVWEGYYPAEGLPEEPMYVPTFNAAAIDDYRRFLEAAPPETFIDTDNDSSCSQN